MPKFTWMESTKTVDALKQVIGEYDHKLKYAQTDNPHITHLTEVLGNVIDKIERELNER